MEVVHTSPVQVNEYIMRRSTVPGKHVDFIFGRLCYLCVCGTCYSCYRSRKLVEVDLGPQKLVAVPRPPLLYPNRTTDDRFSPPALGQPK